MRFRTPIVVTLLVAISTIVPGDRLSAAESPAKVSVYFARLNIEGEPLYSVAYRTREGYPPTLRIVDTAAFAKDLYDIPGDRLWVSDLKRLSRELREKIGDLTGVDHLREDQLTSLPYTARRLRDKDGPLYRAIAKHLSEEAQQIITEYLAESTVSDRLRDEILTAINKALEARDLAERLDVDKQSRREFCKRTGLEPTDKSDLQALRRFNRALVHDRYPGQLLRRNRDVLAYRFVLRHVPRAEPLVLDRRVNRQALGAFDNRIAEWISKSQELKAVNRSMEIWQVREGGEEGKTLGNFAFFGSLFFAAQNPSLVEEETLAEVHRTETSLIALLAAMSSDELTRAVPPVRERMLDLPSLEKNCKGLKELIGDARRQPLTSNEGATGRLSVVKEITRYLEPEVVWTKGPPHLLQNPGLRPQHISFPLEYEPLSPFAEKQVRTDIPPLALRPCSEIRLLVETRDNIVASVAYDESKRAIVIGLQASMPLYFERVKAEFEQILPDTYKITLTRSGFSTVLGKLLAWMLPILIFVLIQQAYRWISILFKVKKEKKKYRLTRDDLRNPKAIFDAIREAGSAKDSPPCPRRFRERFPCDFIEMIDDYRDWDLIPKKIIASILREANRLITDDNLKTDEDFSDKRFGVHSYELRNIVRQSANLSRALRSERIFRKTFDHELMDEETQSRENIQLLHFKPDEFSNLSGLTERVRNLGRGRACDVGHQGKGLPAIVWGSASEETRERLITAWKLGSKEEQLIIQILNEYIEKDDDSSLDHLAEKVGADIVEMVSGKPEMVRRAALRRLSLEVSFQEEFSGKLKTSREMRLKRIPDRQDESQAYRFQESDIVLPGRFAARIHRAGEPISSRIHGSLPTETQRELARFVEGGDSPDDYCDALLLLINQLLCAKELLYEIDHLGKTSYYERIAAEKETLSSPWLGKVKLNRLLLEIAFPDAVRRLRIRDTDLPAEQGYPEVPNIGTLREQASRALSEARYAGITLSVSDQNDPLESLRSNFVEAIQSARKQKDDFREELEEIDKRLQLKYQPLAQSLPANPTRLERLERLLTDYSGLRDQEAHLHGKINRLKQKFDRTAGELESALKRVRSSEEELATTKSDLELAESKSRETEEELDNWRTPLEVIGEAPEEILGKWDSERSWSSVVGELPAKLDQVFGGISTSWTDVQAALAGREKEGLAAWTERAQTKITSLWRFVQSITSARYHRIYGSDPAFPPPIFADFEEVEHEYSKLGKQEDTYRQLERSTPRCGNVRYVVSALEEVVEKLIALAQPEGKLEIVLANTGLEPAFLADAVQGAAEASEQEWHRLLIEASEELAEDGADENACSRIFRDFLHFFLAGHTIATLTHLKRFQQITTVYCRGAEDLEIATIPEATSAFRAALAELEEWLRAIGVELAPFRFFEPPDAVDSWDFKEHKGRPHIFKSSVLQTITVGMVGQQEGRLDKTVSDVSLWGFRCNDYPELSRVSAGWLVRTWEKL